MEEKFEHGCLAGTEHDREVPELDLMSPLKIRDITFKHRLGMSPMCQYSAHEGLANDWHLVNLGTRAAGGVSLAMVEASAVTRDGRITPGDLGIWADHHVEPLKRISTFVRSQGAVAGIQLAHAGRKGSSAPPFHGGDKLKTVEEGGWTVVAPSPIPFLEGDPLPKELTENDILDIVQSFIAAGKRALEAGFQLLEVHSAHGYLLHQFLSPLSNHRKDRYGGSLENRMRFPLQVVEGLRKELPSSQPLFVRISATDWVEGGWDIEQSIAYSKKLKNLGVDLIDVSSGGITPKARIPVAKGYQVPFARRIRDEAGIKTAAVGLITDPLEASEIITSGDADLILIGRELLRDPYFALKAEQELGCDPCWPLPYGYAVKRRPN